MKFKYLALLLIILSFLSLTFALRGAMPKTYEQSEIPASAVQTTLISYNLGSGTKWGFNDFSMDAGNWQTYNSNINSSLYVESGLLFLKANFDKPEHQFAMIYRYVDINVSELPIFSINISVSEGIAYHVRFVGLDSEGVEQEIWWETSPLEFVQGKSTWETHSIDLSAFSEQATGRIIPKILFVKVIIDKPSDLVEGEKLLCITSIEFVERNLKITKVPENANAGFFSDNEPFQAVIIDLPQQYRPEGFWNIRWATITYNLTSNLPSEYRIYLFSRNSGLLLEAQGSIFLSREGSSTDIYRLDAPSERARARGVAGSEELTFVWSLLGNFSIVIVKSGWDQGSFQTFNLESVEIASALANSGEA